MKLTVACVHKLLNQLPYMRGYVVLSVLLCSVKQKTSVYFPVNSCLKHHDQNTAVCFWKTVIVWGSAWETLDIYVLNKAGNSSWASKAYSESTVLLDNARLWTTHRFLLNIHPSNHYLTLLILYRVMGTIVDRTNTQHNGVKERRGITVQKYLQSGLFQISLVILAI